MQTFRITRNAAAAVAAIICLAAAPQDVFSASVKKPQQSNGLAVSPVAGTYDLVDLDGPGVFVSAFMSKQGGATDITFVSLIIDGQTVVNRSIAALKNFGLTQNNPYGVSVSTSAAEIDVVTIGFSEPLKFREYLLLQAIVGDTDTGVLQILGTVIHGRW